MTCFQVKFINKTEDNAIHYGILDTVSNKVICACCGVLISKEDVLILEIFSDWLDFSEYISEELEK